MIANAWSKSHGAIPRSYTPGKMCFLDSNSTNHSKMMTSPQSRHDKYCILIGPAGLEPATPCLEVPLELLIDKGFTVLGCAGVRKTAQENCDFAPWAHPINPTQSDAHRAF